MSSLVRAVVSPVELFRSRALYLISKNGSQRLEIGLIVTGRVWLVPVRGFVSCVWFQHPHFSSSHPDIPDGPPFYGRGRNLSGGGFV